MKILNELVENGYEAEDLDELYEFCEQYIAEYEEVVELNEATRAAKVLGDTAAKAFRGKGWSSIRSTQSLQKNMRKKPGTGGVRYLNKNLPKHERNAKAAPMYKLGTNMRIR